MYYRTQHNPQLKTIIYSIKNVTLLSFSIIVVYVLCVKLVLKNRCKLKLKLRIFELRNETSD